MKATTETFLAALAKHDKGEPLSTADNYTVAAVVTHATQLADALRHCSEEVRTEILDAVTKSAHGISHSDCAEIEALGERFNRWRAREKK